MVVLNTMLHSVNSIDIVESSFEWEWFSPNGLEAANGWKHISFSRHCFIFSNTTYNDNDKKEARLMPTKPIANIYQAITMWPAPRRLTCQLLKSPHLAPCPWVLLLGPLYRQESTLRDAASCSFSSWSLSCGKTSSPAVNL